MRTALYRVTFGSRQELLGACQRTGFGLLAGVGHNPRQRGARRHVIGLGMPLLAELISGEVHLPPVNVHLAFAEMFRLHPCPNNCAAPFSTGAPTKLPHSV